MPELTAPEIIALWTHWTLEWIGFGTLVGLLAKAIMPGRDPGGAVATLLMGIGGAIIGAGIVSFFWEGTRVTPLSPAGFFVSVAGAFVILAFYRLLAGYYFVEGEGGRYYARTPYRRRARRPVSVVVDD